MVKATKKATKKAPKDKKKASEPKMSTDDLALRIQALERTVGKIASGYAYRKILSDLLSLNRELTKADAGTIMLLDRQNKQLVFDVVQGKASAKLQNFRMPQDEGIAGWVAQSGEPVLVPEPEKDPHYNPKVSRNTRYETRNMVCVPIMNDGLVLGVLQLINHGDGDAHPFHTKDLRTSMVLAQTMAQILTGILDNGLDE